MLEQLMVLSLLPIYLAQGLYVRAVTPRLPEPPGERCGRVGDGAALRLLIAGDSAAAGVGVSTQRHALAGRLIELLGETHCVQWRLAAQTGDASEDLLARLRDLPTDAFDVALISIGVNDVTGRTPDPVWRRNLVVLLALLRSKFGVRHVILTAIPPMHEFPALPQPLRRWLGRRARRLDATLRQVATNAGDCTYLAPDFPLEPGYIADDGFHPGAKAYALWAQAAAESIRDVADGRAGQEAGA